jgi:hypothetical protein
VRNNLFHGGKFADGSIENPDRNEQLLRVSLRVMHGILDLPRAHDIQEVFEG